MASASARVACSSIPAAIPSRTVHTWQKRVSSCRPLARPRAWPFTTAITPIAGLRRLLQVEPQVVEGGEPVLDVAPYLLVAAVGAPGGRARLERPPLEVGVHASQHPVDVTAVECLDDLVHQLDARLHERDKYRAAAGEPGRSQELCDACRRHRGAVGLDRPVVDLA